MTKREKTYNRYSICFKEKVVQEVSSGSSISEVSRRYGIKGGATYLFLLTDVYSRKIVGWELSPSL